MQLPNELWEMIFDNLDTFSRIKTKIVCKQFAHIIKIDAIQELILFENMQELIFPTINHFIDHIHDTLLETRKTYYLTRMINTNITFIKRSKNNYSVEIHVNGIRRIRIFYNRHLRRYRFYKFLDIPIELPVLFYVIAMRFMKKIYKKRPCTYNFGIDKIPEIYRRMLYFNYKGTILPEILTKNLLIT